MHELSIARSLLGLVKENTPADATLKSVTVRVGPLQAIEPRAMQFAWQAAIDATSFDGVQLSLTLVPWKLHCRECDRHWTSETWSDPCTCGSCQVDPVGGDEITLVSLDIDEPTPTVSKDSQPVMRKPA